MKKNIGLKVSLILNLLLVFALLFVVLGTTSANSTLPNNATKKIKLKYEQRTSLFRQLETHNVDAVFIGDSITERSLWNEFFPDKVVVNRGIESDTTTGVLKRLDNINSLNPKKIFLLIGINDLRYGEKVESVFVRYSNIISTLQNQSPNTQIYIQSVFPVVEGKGNIKNKDIDELNKKIKTLATTDNIVYIDINSRLKLNDGLNPKYSNDGLHIMGNAYVIWADTIRKYIE